MLSKIIISKNLKINIHLRNLLSVINSQKKKRNNTIKRFIIQTMITNHRDLIEFKPKSLTFRVTPVTRQPATRVQS